MQEQQRIPRLFCLLSREAPFSLYLPLRKAHPKQPQLWQALNNNPVIQYVNTYFTKGLGGTGLPEQSQERIAETCRVDILKHGLGAGGPRTMRRESVPHPLTAEPLWLC